MEDTLEIKVNRKLVYKKSTEYINDLTSKYFATADEVANYEYIYVDTIDKNECRVADAAEISIKELKKIIEKVEKTGANFIAIDFHGDHGEYDIYGFEMVRAQPKEIEENDKTIAEAKEEKKATKIAELQAQIDKIKSE